MSPYSALGLFLSVQVNSYVSFIAAILGDRVNQNSAVEVGFQWTRVRLETGKDYGLSLPTFNPVDTNSAVNILFQVKNIHVAPVVS